MIKYQSMAKIKKHNPKFFADDAMDHMGSVVETGCLKGGYFVTSERPHSAKGKAVDKRFTARRATRAEDKGRYYPFIENIGGLGEHKTRAEAITAIKRHRELTTLKGRALVQEMTDRVGINEQPYGISAFAEPTRGVCLIVSTQQGYENPLVESLTFESIEHIAKTLGDGEGAMSPEWVGKLLETVVMADEMMSQALMSAGYGGLAGAGGSARKVN